MEPIRIKPEKFKLNNFINYYKDNSEELLSEFPNSISRTCLIDKDYMDVISFDEDYEGIEESEDYINLLLNEEYSLHFAIGRTYEGAEKLEFIDGKKYNMKHYLEDLYADIHVIKEIGDLSLDLDHLVGLLFDFADGEIIISVVNFEHGGGIGPSRIQEVEDSGDLEEIIKSFIERFRN
ncbi:MAG: hypothetical protein RR942_15700 [Romboutsia sp.]